MDARQKAAQIVKMVQHWHDDTETDPIKGYAQLLNRAAALIGEERPQKVRIYWVDVYDSGCKAFYILPKGGLNFYLAGKEEVSAGMHEESAALTIGIRPDQVEFVERDG